MARSKSETKALPVDVPLNEDVAAAPEILSALTQGLSDERDLVNQLLGQAQMADAFTKFSKTVFISKLAYVKENKLYRGLHGKSSEDGLQLQGTWEEFCKLLDWAPQHANEAIANLRAFGEEALSSMSRMGIGYRELRQYRRLPDDEKAALIEVAESGDTAAFVDLAETLIDKHTKEKEALQARAEEAEADYDAQSQVLTKRAEELDKARHDLAKAKRRIQTLSAEESTKELRQEVTAIAYEAEVDIAGKLREAFTVLAQHTEETGADHSGFQATLVRQLENLLASIRSEFHLPDIHDTEGRDAFPWLDKDAPNAAQGN